MGSGKVIRLTDDEFIRLCTLMKQEFGIDLSKKRVLIEYRLLNELKSLELNDYSSYLKCLRDDESGNLKATMIDCLTTNYTYFLREESHFDYILKKILTKIPKNQHYTIWVAGCSSGQECYTLAMKIAWARYYEGIDLPDVSIVATDISKKMLQLAKAGEYSLDQLSRLPEAMQRAFCKVIDDKKFIINKEKLPPITFKYQNLMDEFYRDSFDLIMCRNVMIYFDDEIRKKILANLALALHEHGYLVLGHVEVMPIDNNVFTSCGASIYQKIMNKQQGERK